MVAPIHRIYLTGFMGAGKTTVGRILAGRLGWQFFDVDSVIETEERLPIAALFAQRGEPAFRLLEHTAIERLHGSMHTIISLGGGALETPAVRTLLHTSVESRLVFLDAPLDLLIGRCLAQDGGAARPLLHDTAHLDQRYRFRRAYYENAHHTVATQSLTPEEVAAAIQHLLAAPHHGDTPDPSL